MSEDFKQFKDFQKFQIEQEKKRLGLLKTDEYEYVGNRNEGKTSKAVDQIEATQRERQHVEAVPPLDLQFSNTDDREQTVSLVERLDLSCNEGSLEKEKRSFIDRLVNSENPLTVRSDDTFKSAMSRWGEYSPNRFPVATAPYLGLGEYDQRKQLLSRQRQADYKEHINQKNERIKTTAKNLLTESRLVSAGLCKAVQTDIQNIHNKLICTGLDNQVSKDSSSKSTNCNKENQYCNTNVQRIDQRLTSDQNSQLRAAEMDKPRSILSNRRTGTPTDHLMSDYNHGYGSSFLDGFSYHDSIDEVQRERLKREAYQQELRKQIEEKRRLSELRLEQDRIEQERENRRLEQQLLRMHEEQLRDDQIRAIRDEQARRNGDDYMSRHQDMPYRSGYRKRLESESSPLGHRNTNIASKLPHYSPPVTRRNYVSHTLPASSSSSYPGTSPRYGTIPSSRYDSSSLTRKDTLNRMDLLNSHGDAFLPSSSSYQRDHHYHTSPSSRFSRFDSLSRIDLLKQQDMLNRLETLSINDNSFGMCSNGRVERRHSATQQDLSMLCSRRSPKMQRRSSSSRLDEPLPTPILKAHSPVARELKNSIAVNSGRMAPSSSSDLFRRYEDKWQVPSKNLSHHGDGLMLDGQNRSILTQLGTIRMQLQKEQLRMDETLRQRSSQSKAVNFH